MIELKYWLGNIGVYHEFMDTKKQKEERIKELKEQYPHEFRLYE